MRSRRSGRDGERERDRKGRTDGQDRWTDREREG
jgi:hypothetical protein